MLQFEKRPRGWPISWQSTWPISWQLSWQNQVGKRVGGSFPPASGNTSQQQFVVCGIFFAILVKKRTYHLKMLYLVDQHNQSFAHYNAVSTLEFKLI
jgi:hypothetical protein